MSRKSRWKTKEAEKKRYQAAIYTRLSVWDQKTSEMSIENQERLLRTYVREHNEMECYGVCSDQGVSGVRFDRPGFQKMLDWMKQGKINCILIKDFSRLGRNYLEMGEYVERIFHTCGVRLISVNDGYDSLYAKKDEMLTVALKNIYHAYYAVDISQKIVSHLDSKKKAGLCSSGKSPYGYSRSIENGGLVQEEAEAYVVRQIFKRYLRGESSTVIARWLNQERIPTYTDLRRGTGEFKKRWNPSSVLAILDSPVYCGCLIERKSEGGYYLGKERRYLEKSEWNWIKETHEPIVAREVFEKVQSFRNGKGVKEELF